jgi:hypothetical protein
MKQKILIKVLFTIIVVILFACSSEKQHYEWYKGNLHCHSFWSDGNSLPELVVEWYKEQGFHFVSLTDHDILQLNPDRWRVTPQALIDEANNKFGANWSETKVENDRTLVRLKTYAELAQELNEDGRFLLIPGHEQNATVAGFVLHANAINITESIPFPNHFSSVTEAALAWRKASLENSEKNGLESFWMLNHPSWPYYDISAEVLIEVSDIEFFETRNVCSGPRKQQDLMPDEEKYWDIINAFRIHNGNKPIYGIATDDAHDYFNFRDNSDMPGVGWVAVRSEKLDANSLIRSMKNGDFYSSTGVVLKDIRFNPRKRTLTVEIDPEENVQYTIKFVGTKKGFDTKREPFEIPADEDLRLPARKGFTYSDEIGITFHTVIGNSATYKMAPDDMYVRAIITSNKRVEFAQINKPDMETAWTQPVGW